METRLLHLNTSHATGFTDLQSSTNFVCLLGNANPNLRTDILGFSIESVGFENLLPNVREGKNSFVFHRNGINWPLTIPGNVYYNINTFATALNDAIASVVPGSTTVTVAVGASPSGNDLLLFTVIEPNATLIHIDGDINALTYVIGNGSQQFTIADGGPTPYAPIMLRPNLAGEQAVVIQTRDLLASRVSLDGEGKSTASILTVPITVDYGATQTLFNNGIERPTTVYGPQTSFDLNEVDISIRYLDGSLAFLDNTNMFITLRVWLQSK